MELIHFNLESRELFFDEYKVKFWTESRICDSKSLAVLQLQFYVVLIIFPQWLKQIEETEAALAQKMIDLENEKVSKPFLAALYWGLIDKNGD